MMFSITSLSWSPRNDEELKKDIELSLSLGFNGARLHQKVFDPRFLYFCDLYGYMVWGEYASWGLDYSNPAALGEFLPQWLESVERDFNHPAIIGWCPFNETWNYRGRKQNDGLIKTVYEITKLFDCTRPCIDTSGNFHVKTDIYDVHDYRYDPAAFKKSYDRLLHGELYEHVLKDNPGRQKYGGAGIYKRIRRHKMGSGQKHQIMGVRRRRKDGAGIFAKICGTYKCRNFQPQDSRFLLYAAV